MPYRKELSSGITIPLIEPDREHSGQDQLQVPYNPEN